MSRSLVYSPVVDTSARNTATRPSQILNIRTIGDSQVNGTNPGLYTTARLYESLMHVRDDIVVYVTNHAVGGKTSTQVVSEQLPSIVAGGQTHVVCWCGINDVAGGTAWTAANQNTYRANMIRIINHVRSCGSIPVMVGMATDASKPTDIGMLAFWLAEYCRKNGVIYVPWAQGVKEDTSGRSPASGVYRSDRLHLSISGCDDLATKVLAAIVDGAMYVPPLLTDNRLDNGHSSVYPGKNLLANSCFIDNTGAANTASWSVSARFTASTAVKGGGEPLMKGRWYIGTQNNIGGEAQINSDDFTLPADHVSGDQLYVGMRMKTVNHSGLKNATTVIVLWWNGGDYLSASTVNDYIGRDDSTDYGFLVHGLVTPPATATKGTLRISLQPETNANIGTPAEVHIAQPTVRQVTRILRDVT